MGLWWSLTVRAPLTLRGASCPLIVPSFAKTQETALRGGMRRGSCIRNLIMRFLSMRVLMVRGCPLTMRVLSMRVLMVRGRPPTMRILSMRVLMTRCAPHARRRNPKTQTPPLAQCHMLRVDTAQWCHSPDGPSPGGEG